MDMRTLILIALLLIPRAASAAECDREQAVLHGKDFYMAEYRWTKSGSFNISVWDSPSLISIVGKLVPGTQAVILTRTKTHCKIKAPEEQGGFSGWVSLSQIKKIISPETQDCVTLPY